MRPKVLIVEDHKLQCRALRQLLLDIPAENRAHRGIEGFTIDMAFSFNGGKGKLMEASRDNTPYDLLLHDLGLPMDDGGHDLDNGLGIQILEKARELKAARATIVITSTDSLQWFQKAVGAGVVDYVRKEQSDKEEAICNRVLACWDDIVADRSRERFEERIRRLVPYAQQGLERCFGVPFSDFMRTVLQQTQRLAEDTEERLGVKVSEATGEPVGQRIRALEQAMSAARREWMKLQKDISPVEGKPRYVYLHRVVSRVLDEIAPCLVYCRAKIKARVDQSRRVLSFGNDVTAIVTEIILGALLQRGEGTADGASGIIEVSVETRRNSVCLLFQDSLHPLKKGEAKRINAAHVIRDSALGRGWGLSVAQLMACRGGGRIKVMKHGQKTTVALQLPVEHDG